MARGRKGVPPQGGQDEAPAVLPMGPPPDVLPFRPPARQRWRHRVEWFPDADLERMLNALGGAGWAVLHCREESRQQRHGDPVRGDVVYVKGTTVILGRPVP